MTRETHRSLESRVDEIEFSDEELDVVEAWRMFLDGRYDPEDPPEPIAGWHEAAERTQRGVDDSS